MAAIILAIIAYVAPSAVQVREVHAPDRHHRVVAPVVHTAAPAVKAVVPAITKPTARSEALTWSKVALAPAVAEGARFEPSGDNCCQPGCKTRCCGTMTCGATDVLPGSSVLSLSLFQTVTLIPCDVASRSGAGPEALPKPPRTLA